MSFHDGFRWYKKPFLLRPSHTFYTADSHGRCYESSFPLNSVNRLTLDSDDPDTTDQDRSEDETYYQMHLSEKFFDRRMESTPLPSSHGVVLSLEGRDESARYHSMTDLLSGYSNADVMLLQEDGDTYVQPQAARAIVRRSVMTTHIGMNDYANMVETVFGLPHTFDVFDRSVGAQPSPDAKKEPPKKIVRQGCWFAEQCTDEHNARPHRCSVMCRNVHLKHAHRCGDRQATLGDVFECLPCGWQVTRDWQPSAPLVQDSRFMSQGEKNNTDDAKSKQGVKELRSDRAELGQTFWNTRDAFWNLRDVLPVPSETRPDTTVPRVCTLCGYRVAVSVLVGTDLLEHFICLQCHPFDGAYETVYLDLQDESENGDIRRRRSECFAPGLQVLRTDTPVRHVRLLAGLGGQVRWRSVVGSIQLRSRLSPVGSV